MAFTPFTVFETANYGKAKVGELLHVRPKAGIPWYSTEALDGYYSPRMLTMASRPTRFYELGYTDFSRLHFLKACNLCKQNLGEGDDLFMYRGNMPFCSEECRQTQIDADEAKERNRNSIRSKRSTKSSATSNQEESTLLLGDGLCAGTVTAAVG